VVVVFDNFLIKRKKKLQNNLDEYLEFLWINFLICKLVTEKIDEGSEDYNSEEHDGYHPLASPTVDTWMMSADNIGIISGAFPDFSKKPNTYC